MTEKWEFCVAEESLLSLLLIGAVLVENDLSSIEVSEYGVVRLHKQELISLAYSEMEQDSPAEPSSCPWTLQSA